MLGFAMRARKLTLGTELVCKKMPSGTVKLVVISSSASDGTKKKLTTKSEYYKIPMLVIDIDADELGRMLGKLHSTAAVAVTDAVFATEIIKASDKIFDEK